MSGRMPRGFIWDGKFHSNMGEGHEANARNLIWEYKKRFPNEDWNWYNYESAKEFLVMKKKAIQIGSGNEPLCAIASAKVYSKEDVVKKLEKFGLRGYRIYLFWDVERAGG